MRRTNRKRILIVDDDSTYTSFLEKVFTKGGFEVTRSEDALTALTQLDGRRIDLMLIDIMMPDLDGYGLIWALRHHKKYAKYHETPLLALTSLSGSVTRARLKEIEADAWIQKPISPKRLLEVVRAFVPVEVN